jgi:2-methylcitrate dehydratase PrpD
MSTPQSPAVSAGDLVAGFAARIGTAELSDAVIAKTRDHLLDSLAAIVSGAALEAGVAGRRYAESVGGAAAASVLGTRASAPLVEAALANGMSAHADESDDSHETSQTHPGCGVVPAAIVVAESQRASGRELLSAVALGYEMTIRIAEAIGAGMTFKQSSLSSHAYGPLFGAGYAAGSLLGFTAGDFRALLNYLAQEASGLTTWRLDERHTLKSYVFGGMPASNGVKAAALVASGFTGGGDVLDLTNRNMLEAISPEPRLLALVDALGERYRLLETDIKKYPVGFPIASPLAALERLIADERLAANDVTEIRVRYHEDWYRVVGDETRLPDVNLRYCLAVTLLDGRLSFAAAHDAERMSSPAVQAIGRRIRLLGPPAGQDRFAATIEIDARGKTSSAMQDINVRGRYENPMTGAEIRDKARELMRPVLGDRQTERAIALVDTLETLPDVRELVAALKPAP